MRIPFVYTVLSMSEMGFRQKSLDRGWVGGWVGGMCSPVLFWIFRIFSTLQSLLANAFHY